MEKFNKKDKNSSYVLYIKSYPTCTNVLFLALYVYLQIFFKGLNEKIVPWLTGLINCLCQVLPPQVVLCK